MCAPEAPPQPQLPEALRGKRPVTEEDVRQVHMLLEVCIKRCLSKTQAAAALQRYGVEPLFTCLVWDRLEAENPEFFQGYHAKLQALAGLGGLQLAEA